MNLSRIELNPFHSRTYQLVGDPYKLHQKLCSCVSSNRSDAKLLYRIEEGPTILIQSATPLDWGQFGEPLEVFRRPPESKLIEVNVAAGQELGFRLRCRPSKKVAVEGKKNSSFRFLRSEDERLNWLKRQGEQHGFSIVTVEVTYERWRDTKPGSERGVPELPAVRFDGILVVTDPDKLCEAVRNGIGPQKAYGFGLLSLATVRE